MSKKEELSIKANNIQNYINAFLAAFLAVLGWGFVSFDSLSVGMLCALIAGLVGLVVALVVLQLRLNKTAKEIGRLK